MCLANFNLWIFFPLGGSLNEDFIQPWGFCLFFLFAVGKGWSWTRGFSCRSVPELLPKALHPSVASASAVFREEWMAVWFAPVCARGRNRTASGPQGLSSQPSIYHHSSADKCTELIFYYKLRQHHSYAYIIEFLHVSTPSKCNRPPCGFQVWSFCLFILSRLSLLLGRCCLQEHAYLLFASLLTWLSKELRSGADVMWGKTMFFPISEIRTWNRHSICHF